MADARLSADITELEIWRMISQDVKERIAEGDGFWRSCSGCCETSDGYNVNGYPHSSVFGCELGSGCSECGGIGAVWDNLDYSQVGEDGVTGDVAQAAPDSVLLPRKLTAENGAKAALIGEFSETVALLDEDGEEHPMSVPVSWDTIKRIWDAAVAHFAAQPPAAPVETKRKTFTIPPGHEAVRDSEGRATGEVRPRSSAGSGRAEMDAAIKAWLDCPPEKRPTPQALGKRIADIAAGIQPEPFMMLSCREAKQCLHNIPGCICDGDPTNG